VCVCVYICTRTIHKTGTDFVTCSVCMCVCVCVCTCTRTIRESETDFATCGSASVSGTTCPPASSRQNIKHTLSKSSSTVILHSTLSGELTFENVSACSRARITGELEHQAQILKKQLYSHFTLCIEWCVGFWEFLLKRAHASRAQFALQRVRARKSNTDSSKKICMYISVYIYIKNWIYRPFHWVASWLWRFFFGNMLQRERFGHTLSSFGLHENDFNKLLLSIIIVQVVVKRLLRVFTLFSLIKCLNPQEDTHFVLLRGSAKLSHAW